MKFNNFKLSLIFILFCMALTNANCTGRKSFKANNEVEVALTLEKHEVKLTWDAPTKREDGKDFPESELGGFRIYFRSSEQPEYSSQYMVELPASSREYIFDGLPAGVWYFSATAFDKNNLESKLSAEVTKSIQE